MVRERGTEKEREAGRDRGGEEARLALLSYAGCLPWTLPYSGAYSRPCPIPDPAPALFRTLCSNAHPRPCPNP